MKTWEIIIVVAVLAGLALMPAIFKFSIVHYVTGIVSVIAILIALAFFILKTGTLIPDEMKEEEPEDETPKTKLQKCKQSIRRSWIKLYNACNSVGFILFLCILLIIGIGVFDSTMNKNNEVGNGCKCNHETEIIKSNIQHTDSIQPEEKDTIR